MKRYSVHAYYEAESVEELRSLMSRLTEGSLILGRLRSIDIAEEDEEETSSG